MGRAGAQEVLLQRPVSPARWELRREEETLAGHTEAAVDTRCSQKGMGPKLA